MKTWVVCVAVSLAAVTFARAQSPADYLTTCNTLGQLTEGALRRDSRVEVLIYINAALAIRERLTDKNACNAPFFAEVILRNAPQLSQTAAVLSTVGVRPVRGWTHIEIEKLFTVAEKLKPADVLSNIATPRILNFQLDQIKKDLDAIKINRPDLFVPSDGGRVTAPTTRPPQ